MDALLGLDIGTTHLKAGLFDLSLTPLAAAQRPTPVTRPRPGWAEHDPDVLWEACADLIREVVDGRPDVRALAVSVASMGEAGTLVDAALRPVYPIIAWFDNRTEAVVRALSRDVGREAIFRVTGQSVGINFSVTRLMWLREHAPDAFARGRWWLNVPDWIGYRLSGEIATDYTIASRTMAFDQAARDWADALLGRFGLDRDRFPRAVPSGTPIGAVTRAAAARTGLPEGARVVAGGHDHLVAALGAGVREPGVLLDSTGTAESLLTVLDAPLLDDAACRAGCASYCYTARDKYVIVGGLKSSGGMIEWFIDRFCGEEKARVVGGASVYDLLAAQFPGEPGAHGVRVVPDFTGAGTPNKDPLARGAILGLTVGHAKGDVAQALVEAACFWLRSNVEFFEAALGRPIDRVRAVGGGTKNGFWLRTKADVANLPVEVPRVGDAALRGAALLAGIGAGVFADEADALARAPVTCAVIEPDPDRAARYAELYPGWLRACAAVRALGG